MNILLLDIRIPTNVNATNRIQTTRFSKSRPRSSFAQTRNPAATLQTLVKATAFSRPRRGKIRNPISREPAIPPNVFNAESRPTSAPIPLALEFARRIPIGNAIPTMIDGTSMTIPMRINCWLSKPVPTCSMKLIQTISAGAIMIPKVSRPLRICKAPNREVLRLKSGLILVANRLPSTMPNRITVSVSV